MIIKIILHSDLLILYFLVLFLDLVTVTLTVSWTDEFIKAAVVLPY